MGDGLHRVPARILLKNYIGFCIIFEADPRPFSKLYEYPTSSELERIGFLGGGGSGSVYQVKIPNPNILVEEAEEIIAAEKCYMGIEDLEDRQIEEFRREVMFLTTIEHDNIIKAYGYSRNPPRIFLEYIEYGDLHSVIEKKELSPENAHNIILGIALAMEFLHELGYVHRDLKPGNVLIQKV